MGSDNQAGLSPAEQRDLHRIAGIMIPANVEYRVPGADDPDIFADIVRSIGRDLPDVRTALGELSRLAGGDFAALGATEAEAVASELLASETPAVTTLGRVILQCYYRDDRVLLSLGVEPRPPFPKGHVLEQGDWSLLDVVKQRKPFWRDDRAV